MNPSPLFEALRATVQHCESAQETGDRERLSGALLFMAGHVEQDDPRAAELLQALVESTR